MANENNNRKLGAFGTSILIHGALLLAIATMTVQLTMPEGNVSGTIEFNAVPQGQQLITAHVEETAKPESPEKVKRADAPAPPPAPAPIPKISEDAIKDVEVDAEGTMDVVEDKPEYPQHLPTKEIELQPETKIEPMKAVEEAPQAEEPEETAQLPIPPVVGTNAEKTVQPGNDIADLKGQDKIEDKNFGANQGVKNADQFLRAVPGNKQPSYPWVARLRRIEGQVLVHFKVSENGEVSDLKIMNSTNEVFNKEVLQAMSGWKFIPPVDPGIYEKPWTFTLKGEAKEAPALLRRKK